MRSILSRSAADSRRTVNILRLQEGRVRQQDASSGRRRSDLKTTILLGDGAEDIGERGSSLILAILNITNTLILSFGHLLVYVGNGS